MTFLLFDNKNRKQQSTLSLTPPPLPLAHPYPQSSQSHSSSPPTDLYVSLNLIVSFITDECRTVTIVELEKPPGAGFGLTISGKC